MSREARNFFPEFNIRLYDKNSESDYFFFLHQNHNIFFSNIGNQNIFLEKNHNPPFKLNGRSLIDMLDAKSAFDVVRHTNLIRKLYHYRISTRSILLIDSLYRNATTKIKWKGHISEEFKIEQGDRQGGTLSADLYKIYINQLLDLMQESNLGAKIGNINCMLCPHLCRRHSFSRQQPFRHTNFGKYCL